MDWESLAFSSSTLKWFSLAWLHGPGGPEGGELGGPGGPEGGELGGLVCDGGCSKRDGTGREGPGCGNQHLL